jgi:hypothetical protein
MENQPGREKLEQVSEVAPVSGCHELKLARAIFGVKLITRDSGGVEQNHMALTQPRARPKAPMR